MAPKWSDFGTNFLIKMVPAIAEMAKLDLYDLPMLDAHITSFFGPI